jgi:polyisoprenoid-binding protein YceI
MTSLRRGGAAASLAVLGLLFAGSIHASQETFAIDAAHSGVQFRVRHFTAKTPGKFNAFSGEILVDRSDLTKSSVSVEIDAASVDTDNADRDSHLKTADFFDVEKFPTLAFKSTKVTQKGEDNLVVEGMLTMHGVTKPVTLDVEIGGFMKDPWGNERAGFDARTKINRKDFGISFNKTLDQGGLMLGEEVEITLSIEAVKKAPEPMEAKKWKDAK